MRRFRHHWHLLASVVAPRATVRLLLCRSLADKRSAPLFYIFERLLAVLVLPYLLVLELLLYETPLSL